MVKAVSRLRFSAMRVRGLAASVALVAAGVAAGCGDDGKCKVDTDCPLRERCSEMGRCVPLGRDAGPDAGTLDAGPPDAGMDAGPMLGRGQVVLLSDALERTGDEEVDPRYEASATFARSSVDMACTTSMVGACEVVDCPDPAEPDGGVDAGADAGPDAGLDAGVGGAGAPSAGAIDVTGGLQDLSLTPGVEGRYETTSDTTLLWDGTETMLQVTAAGAEVPAFSAVVTGPASLTLTMPETVESVVILRDEDAAFAWSGETPGDVVVAIAWSDPDSPATAQLRCRWTVADGAATIPSAALSRLPAGVVTVEVYTEAATEADVAGWEIDVRARAGARLSTERAARFDAELQ